MRIAQIAPPMESVPPAYYGGTERVVSYLTEELVRQGHQVTLFASGDSLTSAELVSSTRVALRLTPTVQDPIPYYLMMLDKVRERADEFDILHFHIDQFHFPIFRPIAHRTLTTLHGRQDLTDLQALYRGFSEMPLVSISNAQREPAPFAQYVATVYHGIPIDLHAANVGRRGTYLAFLGRICPEKRVDHAIAIARASNIPLKIAAKLTRSTKPISAKRSRRFLTGRTWSLWEKSTNGPRRNFSVTRSHCCFPSTGQNRSGLPLSSRWRAAPRFSPFGAVRCPKSSMKG